MGMFNRNTKITVDDLFEGTDRHYFVIPRSILIDGSPLVRALAKADPAHVIAKRNYEVHLRGASGYFVPDRDYSYANCKGNHEKIKVKHAIASKGPRS